MTSRQAGRRMAKLANRQRKKPAARTAAGKKSEALRPADRRLMGQAVVCGAVFVLLVAAKLLLPGKLEQVDRQLSGALRQNMDVEAVFSAVGRAVSGESSTVRQVYQAVFHPEEEPETVLKTSAAVPAGEGTDAWEELKQNRLQLTGALPEAMAPEEPPEAPRPQAATLAYIQYSAGNLPENVSLEQAILDFDYCVPTAGTLSSGFGYREHPIEGEERFHYGVDLAANTGTEIRAFAAGTVTAVGDSSSYGKYCTVSHPGGFSTLYAHCSKITVSSGAAVTKGQKIAEVGQTGVATGPHLHFELHRDGVYLNPIYYVAAA